MKTEDRRKMNKLNILLVDDEPNILNGYRRILHPMSGQCNIFMAPGGRAALDTLADIHIDIIVSDMRMPGLDGVQLLTEVKNKYPHVVRFILSGFTEKDAAIRASGLAHQVLAKPANAELLKSAISRIYTLRESFGDGNIVKVITSVDQLPAQPELYLRLKATMDIPQASIKHVGEIISGDPAMTAKILQMVNSAFFGLPHRVIDPFQAVSFLGFDIVKALVLFAKIFIEYQGDDYPEQQSYWTHSLLVGRLAEAICKEQGLNPKECESAFISGMLHDIGKLVMSRIPGYFSHVRQAMNERNISFAEAEYLIWGSSHAEAGASLLSLWGLPQEITDILNYHHFPLKSANMGFSVLTAVYIADCFNNGYPLNAEYISLTGLENRVEDFRKLIKTERDDNE